MADNLQIEVSPIKDLGILYTSALSFNRHIYSTISRALIEFYDSFNAILNVLPTFFQ